MYRNREKIVALLLAMFLIGGCASKRDFTQGVSEEDKKLLSGNKYKGLFRYRTIVITQNGFYPYIEGEYDTKVASYLDVKKFNLKKFMDDVNKYNLKALRLKVLALKKKYPSVSLKNAKKIEIETISSPNISQYEIDKILVKCTPNYLNKIVNPSKELKQIALKSCEYEWNGSTCTRPSYSAPSSSSSYSAPSSSSSYSGSSSSSGYSGSSSGCRIKTICAPGIYPCRQVQTTICN